MSDVNYSALERLLHHLALQIKPVAQFSFDLEQALLGNTPEETRFQRHVFVSGLARAGTTALMRRFHATGRFRSLTYRDMPFVLAPNLWRRIVSLSPRDIVTKERAHGDAVKVNADSPESLEEVFWRIFTGDQYLCTQSLVPHRPAEHVIERYVRYIGAILSTSAPHRYRYLSKNNNNMLRLESIKEAFPNSLLLIPFRDPLQHARSLQRQHARFKELQGRHPFVRSYMTWLGHHEFGLDHRPFRFERAAGSIESTATLDYWLGLWCATYGWLERNRPCSAVFVCYEDLCNGNLVWTRLAELAEVPEECGWAEPFRLREYEIEERVDRGLTERAAAIHERLINKSRASLG